MKMIEPNLFLISPPKTAFEESYLQLRQKENRLYSDTLLSQLPFVPKDHPHHKEWTLRKTTALRFIKYLNKKHSNSRLLELGCGNGWFTNLCSEKVKSAIGVDINLTELKQASSVFKKESLKFYYWDVFAKSPFNSKFDLIVLNASIQYFDDLQKLFSRLKELLNQGGEIHILDSPFYRTIDLKAARERSRLYYQKIGFPEMRAFYFHHDKETLIEAGFEEWHKGETNRFLLFLKSASPFGWFSYRKQSNSK